MPVEKKPAMCVSQSRINGYMLICRYLLPTSSGNTYSVLAELSSKGKCTKCQVILDWFLIWTVRYEKIILLDFSCMFGKICGFFLEQLRYRIDFDSLVIFIKPACLCLGITVFVVWFRCLINSLLRVVVDLSEYLHDNIFSLLLFASQRNGTWSDGQTDRHTNTIDRTTAK